MGTRPAGRRPKKFSLTPSAFHVSTFFSKCIVIEQNSGGFSCQSRNTKTKVFLFGPDCNLLWVRREQTKKNNNNRTAGTLSIGSRTTLSASNSSTNGGPSGNGNEIGNGSAKSHSPGGSALGAVGGPVTSSPTSSPAPQSSGQNKSLAAQKQEHPSVSATSLS